MHAQSHKCWVLCLFTGKWINKYKFTLTVHIFIIYLSTGQRYIKTKSRKYYTYYVIYGLNVQVHELAETIKCVIRSVEEHKKIK